MRQHGLRILLLFNVALTLVLAWAWFDTSGQLRNIHWSPPPERKPDFLSDIAAPPALETGDVGRFMATLDRPLFSPNRRPPPPPPPPDAVAAPTVDPLAGIQLFGVFSSENNRGGGIIARINGKTQRIFLQEKLGDWTLQGIKEREVTLQRAGGETRVLPLAHARGPQAAPAVAAAPSVVAAPDATPANASNAVAEQQQRQQQEMRERLARRNAIRARAGLPPIIE